MARLTRRRFGQTLAAGAAALAAPRLVNAESPQALPARAGMARLAPEGYPDTAIWGYEGLVPGPEIRVAQGGRVTRRFVNELPQPSSVHWHGIRIDNAMDGVPGVTQAVVESGSDFLYDFKVPDAGTFWYHPHNRTFEQMARGLYGPLIVEEAEGSPEIDGDAVLMLDDWRLTDTAQISEDIGALHDMAHAGRIGNWITVNGQGAWQRPVRQNERLRLRLINTANARIFTLTAEGLAGWVVALDGMPLERPEPLTEVTLAPAQRADLLVDVTAAEGGEALLVSMERDGGFAVASFPVKGTARAKLLPAAAPLPPNPVPALGPLREARAVELLMEGGAMGGLQGATLEGRRMEMRELVEAGMVWAMNGMAGMPEAPLIEVTRGETVRMALGNDTAWPHGMHLHGHHVRTVSADGTLGPLRDTVLMAPREAIEIAFVADNPGDWLLHCHMLEHAASGMMTWIRVT